MASEQLQQWATIFLGMRGGGTIETIFRLASARWWRRASHLRLSV